MNPVEIMTVKAFRKLKPAGRREQPETAIRSAIRGYLQVHGWKIVRIVQSALSEKGIPDLVAIRDGVTVWLEIKRPGGKLSEYQRAWREDLEAHGGNWMLARSIEDIEFLASIRKQPETQP